MKSADFIIPNSESYVHKYAWTPWGNFPIRAAELGNNAALMGQFRSCHKTTESMNKILE